MRYILYYYTFHAKNVHEKVAYSLNTGFIKSAHKHMHFFWGLFFNILFSAFEMIAQ